MCDTTARIAGEQADSGCCCGGCCEGGWNCVVAGEWVRSSPKLIFDLHDTPAAVTGGHSLDRGNSNALFHKKDVIC